MSALSIIAVAATLASAPAAPEVLVPPPNAAVKAYAGAMAVAKTVSERCSDILVDATLLDGLRDRLRIGESDGPALAAEGRYVANLLSRTIADAPNVKAWCDATFEQYGPAGTTLPGLLGR